MILSTNLNFQGYPGDIGDSGAIGEKVCLMKIDFFLDNALFVKNGVCLTLENTAKVTWHHLIFKKFFCK